MTNPTSIEALPPGALPVGEGVEGVKERALGGPDAAVKWRAAMDALHAYARASNCPLGLDVVQWFRAQSHELHLRIGAHRRAAARSQVGATDSQIVVPGGPQQ